MKIVAYNSRWIVVETVPETGKLANVEVDGAAPGNAKGFWVDRKHIRRGPESYLFLVRSNKPNLVEGTSRDLPLPEYLATMKQVEPDDSFEEAPRGT